MRSWHLVAYDVRDDRRLRQTARVLEGYGERVQLSVFRCRLTKTELERLRWELAKVLEPADDLLIIPLCDRCAAAIRQRRGQSWDAETTFRVI